MYYTVGEIAKKMDLNASTLRYYDKEGLLPFVERTKGGIRMFKDSDMGMLNIIGCLKDTGMSIKDIKTFVSYYRGDDENYDHRMDIIENQKMLVLEQMQALKDNLEILDYKAWYYEKARVLGSLDAVERLPKSEIPKQFHKHLTENLK